MKYEVPCITVIDQTDLEQISVLASSVGCVFSGACTGGPSNTCSTLDAWH